MIRKCAKPYGFAAALLRAIRRGFKGMSERGGWREDREGMGGREKRALKKNRRKVKWPPAGGVSVCSAARIAKYYIYTYIYEYIDAHIYVYAYTALQDFRT